MANLERYVTPDDIAESLQVSRKSVMKLIRSGALPCIRLGNRVRVRADEVAAWLSKKGGRP